MALGMTHRQSTLTASAGTFATFGSVKRVQAADPKTLLSIIAPALFMWNVEKS